MHNSENIIFHIGNNLQNLGSFKQKISLFSNDSFIIFLAFSLYLSTLLIHSSGMLLIEFQLIQNRLAGMYIALENVRNLFMKTMYKTIYGGQTRLDVCAAKLYCGEMATWVANEAISILGGYGYMREYIIERLARDAKLLEIGAGTTEMQIITMGRELAATDNF